MNPYYGHNFFQNLWSTSPSVTVRNCDLIMDRFIRNKGFFFINTFKVSVCSHNANIFFRKNKVVTCRHSVRVNSYTCDHERRAVTIRPVGRYSSQSRHRSTTSGAPVRHLAVWSIERASRIASRGCHTTLGSWQSKVNASQGVFAKAAALGGRCTSPRSP